MRNRNSEKKIKHWDVQELGNTELNRARKTVKIRLWIMQTASNPTKTQTEA